MSSEKRFKASSKKKKKAQLEGDIAKSREFTSSFLFFGSLIYLFYFSDITAKLMKLFEISFGSIAGISNSQISLSSIISEIFSVLIACLAPFFGILILIALIFEASQAGFLVNFARIKLTFSRLNIINGLKKLIGLPVQEGDKPTFKQKLYDFFKFLVIISIGVLILVLVLSRNYNFILESFQGDFVMILSFLSRLIINTTLLLSLIFVLAGMLDLFVVRKRHEQKLMMDLQELKQENKSNEGDPLIKSLRKGFHRSLLTQALVQGVRKAKVIVMNR